MLPHHHSLNIIDVLSAEDIDDIVNHDLTRSVGSIDVNIFDAFFANRRAKHYKTLRGFVIASFRQQL